MTVRQLRALLLQFSEGVEIVIGPRTSEYDNPAVGRVTLKTVRRMDSNKETFSDCIVLTEN